MIREEVMRVGRWDINLRDFPDSIFNDFDIWDHILILPQHVDAREFDDASMKAMARYTGVLIDFERIGDDREGLLTHLGGPSIVAHLGDHEDRGQILQAPVAFVTVTFATAINALLPSSVLAGTIGSVAGTYTGEHYVEAPRQSITYVCEVMGAEWRVNPDGTLDAGVTADLYESSSGAGDGDDARAVVARRLPGWDPNIDPVTSHRLGSKSSGEKFATGVHVLGSGDGESIIFATSDLVSNPYKDIHGAALVHRAAINEPETTTDNAQARADAHRTELGQIRESIDLSSAEYHVQGPLLLGGSLWVFEPPTLVDLTNEIEIGGDVVNPAKTRLLGLTWPVTEQEGVYLRDKNGAYTDLTEFVIAESGGVQLQIGDTAPDILPSSTRSVLQTRTSGPDDATVPAVPAHAGTPWGTFSYQGTEGKTLAAITAQWTQPLNTDGSTITDGAYYEVRWRRNGDTDYQYASVFFDTLFYVIYGLEPGVVYEISVQAIDTSANGSGFGADETVTASEDTIAPSQPAAPTVAGNPLEIQVSHSLGKNTGGTFNLEADIDHLKVYADTSTGFTPGEANRLGEIPASAGNLSLGITVVGTFLIVDTTQRFVVVSAVDKAGNESAFSPEATVTAVLIDTQHITLLAVSTALIGNLQVTNAKIADLNAAKIDAGFLSADRLEAGKIATEKLIVGSFDNLVQNPGFEDITNDPHEYVNGGGTWVLASSAMRSGGRVARYTVGSQSTEALLNLNSDTVTLNGGHPAATEGDEFSLQVWVRRGSDVPNTDPILNMVFRDETGATTGSFTTSISGLTTAYQQFTVRDTAPAGTAFVQFRIRIPFGTNVAGQQFFFDDLYARRAVGGAIFEVDLQSDNFVAGSAGWQIRRDTGDTEFNDAIFRGTIEASAYYAPDQTANTNRIIIGVSGGLPSKEDAIQWYYGGNVPDARHDLQPSIFATQVTQGADDFGSIQITSGETNNGTVTHFGEAIVELEAGGDAGGKEPILTLSCGSVVGSASTKIREAKIKLAILAAGAGGGAGNPTLTLEAPEEPTNDHLFLHNGILGLKFLDATAEIQVRDDTDTTYEDLRVDTLFYMTLTAFSARAMKRNIESFAATDIVRAAPAYRWQYDPAQLPDHDGDRVHFGPMVEDLPDEILSSDSLGISLGDQVGVLWQAVRELSERMRTMESRIA